MNYIKNIAVVLLAFLVFTGCDDEDFTGHSSLTPTGGVTISVSGLPTSPLSFIEKDTTLTFTVELFPAQIVDVPVYISQSAGDASLGSDFTIDNNNSRVVIPAYATSGTVSISIMADTEAEGTESFTIKIGDNKTDNGTVTSVEVSFTIGNSTSSDMILDLSWSSADVFSSDGAIYGAEDIVDIDLSVYDDAGVEVFSAEEAGTFETASLDALADGTYTIAANVAGNLSLEPGAILPIVSLQMDYNQLGVQSGSMPFADALDPNQVCSDNELLIATLVKTGSTYELKREGTLWLLPSEPSSLVGSFAGQDSNIQGLGFVGTSIIEGSISDGTVQFDGINQDFMVSIWGESVTTSAPVTLDIDFATGEITIAEQFIFTTDYNGTAYDYTIYGTGRIEPCQLVLEYEMNQDGFLVNEWLINNGYTTDEFFTAIVAYP